MQVHYSLCDNPYATKPTEADIQTFINKSLITEIKPLEGFLQDVSSGKSFCGAIFTENNRCSESFLVQQVFGVDFDKDITVQQATNLLKEWGLNFTCGYYTFRHTEQSPRFRLLFIMNGLLGCPKLATAILQGLFRFFGMKSDKNAKDISRLWHGTNKGVFSGSGDTIDLIEFVTKLNLKIFSDDHKKYRYCIWTERIGNETLSRNGEDYTIYYSNLHFSTKQTFKTNSEKEAKLPVIKDWSIEELEKSFRVVKEFLSGAKLPHDVLMGIARNFLYLNGGQKLFQRVIEANRLYDHKKVDIMAWCKRSRPLPQWVRDFSPYEEDEQFQGSLIDHLKIKVGVATTECPKLMEVEIASKMLNDELQRIMNAPGNDVYLVRSQAGLGKTSFMKKLEGIVLGFPTHKLKQEHFETSLLQNKISAPELMEYFNLPLQRRFRALYGTDLGRNVQMEVKSLASGELVVDASESDVIGAQSYLGALDSIKSSNSQTSIYTTHSKAIFEEFPQQIVVLDESPLSILLEQHFVSNKDMRTLYATLQGRGWNVTALHEILTADADVAHDTPVVSIPQEEIYQIAVENKFNTHVVRFFSSAQFVRTELGFTYTINNIHRMSRHKKFIILDATSSISIYQRLFSDRLKVVDITNVKYKGTLNQHVGLSYSKMGMRKYGEGLEIATNLPILTHKEFSSEDHYYFSLVGTNKYESQDIVCLGTPHKPSVFYKLLMKSLRYATSDFSMQNQRVDYGGRQFKFYTFNDSTLRQYHLETIEGELIQAVNRARPIHHNVTITVYSNFPLLQANYLF